MCVMQIKKKKVGHRLHVLHRAQNLMNHIIIMSLAKKKKLYYESHSLKIVLWIINNKKTH